MIFASRLPCRRRSYARSEVPRRGSVGFRSSRNESDGMTQENRLHFELEETDDVERVQRLLSTVAAFKNTAFEAVELDEPGSAARQSKCGSSEENRYYMRAL